MWRSSSRREEWGKPFYQKLQGRNGITVILKSRKNARVAVSFPRQGNHVELLTRFVQQYYFYLQDQDFGRMFLRICPLLSLQRPRLPQRSRVTGVPAPRGGHRL